MTNIAILTEKRYLLSDSKDWYVQNIIEEDRLVQQELEKLNIVCERKAWDGNFNPKSFKFALFRTTWNYFEKLTPFMEFLKNCKKSVRLINHYDQVIWNLDKKYLLDLKNWGVNIPKTYLAPKNCEEQLNDIANIHGWREVVVKPCVSAAAWNTHYVRFPNSRESKELFRDLNKFQDLIVQEFQKNIVQRGEVSFMMIGGKYSHAVLKKAKPGDFRVQDDFGGSVQEYKPDNKEVDFVHNVIQALPFSPVYARVDVIFDNLNMLAVSELELIEPEMWFRLNHNAAHKLALAIKDYINHF
tara:strand:- start:1948 stop:2844 length:897 start_codon:yes stop_codon:yes gene_type:complete